MVRAESGDPAAQIPVTVRAFAAGIVTTAITDASGRFRVEGLPRGTYIVAVQESGYETIEETVRVDGFAPELLLQLKKTNAPQPAPANYAVSVRELAIPGKAHQAFEKGLQLLAKNDSAASLAHFTRAAAASPSYYEAYYYMGLADMNLGRQDEAEQAFQKAIDLSGGSYAPAQFGMGALLSRQGKFAEAERAIRWGLDRESNFWGGHYLLAVALVGLNRLEEAEERAQAAVFRKPAFSLAHLLLAEIRFRRHDYGPAMQNLDAYFKLEPHGPMDKWARLIREKAEQALSKSAQTPAP